MPYRAQEYRVLGLDLFENAFSQGLDAAFQYRGQEIDIPLLHMNDPIEAVLPIDKTRPSVKKLPGSTMADVHRWANRYSAPSYGTLPESVPSGLPVDGLPAP